MPNLFEWFGQQLIAAVGPIQQVHNEHQARQTVLASPKHGFLRNYHENHRNDDFYRFGIPLAVGGTAVALFSEATRIISDLDNYALPLTFGAIGVAALGAAISTLDK